MVQRCCVCGMPKTFNFLFETKNIRAKELFSIGACELCGVKKVLNVPEDINKYYRDCHMKQKTNKVYSFFKEILLKMELKRILKFSGRNTIFLDIGCGIGNLTRLIHKNALKVVAIDADPKRPICVESIMEIPYHTLDFSSCEINGIHRVDNATVILRHVLEHIIDPEALIKKLMSYGATGFYVVVPNHSSVEDKIFGQYNFYYDPPFHLWFFNKKTLTKFFEKAGLRVVASGYDTIPGMVPSLHRFLMLHNCPKAIGEIFHPQGVFSTLSTPFNFLLPHNVAWVFARQEK